MTKIDQIKILDNKIKANKAQYILNRKNAEISVKSSGELDKYKYLTGVDLDYKPDSIEKAKFEYSPSGKVFTAGLDGDNKKVGLIKTLQDIRDINREQLDWLNEPNNNSRNRGGKGDRDGRNYRGGRGDDDDDDGGNDGGDSGSRNRNLENPLFYDVNHDFRTYKKDYDKATSLEFRFNFMNRFGDRINSLINLSFRENRGTREEAEIRRIRRNNVINSAVNLYNNLYNRHVRDCEQSDRDLKENYDHNKLRQFTKIKTCSLNRGRIRAYRPDDEVLKFEKDLKQYRSAKTTSVKDEEGKTTKLAISQMRKLLKEYFDKTIIKESFDNSLANIKNTSYIIGQKNHLEKIQVEIRY